MVQELFPMNDMFNQQKEKKEKKEKAKVSKSHHRKS